MISAVTLACMRELFFIASFTLLLHIAEILLHWSKWASSQIVSHDASKIDFHFIFGMDELAALPRALAPTTL